MVRSIEICCSVRSQVSGLYCSANPCVLALKINLETKSYILLLSFLVREPWLRQSSKCPNFHLQRVLLNRYFNFSSPWKIQVELCGLPPRNPYLNPHVTIQAQKVSSPLLEILLLYFLTREPNNQSR